MQSSLVKTEVMKNKSAVSTFVKRFTLIGLFLNRFFFIVPGTALVCLLCILFFNSSHGFDITDESFYLLWARNPEQILSSYIQFGYYLKLLYVLSGDNIVLYRILGMLSLFGAGVIFSSALDRYWLNSSGSIVSAHIRWIPKSLILIGTVAYYRLWLLTPSYNWLALLCVFVTATGLLRFVTYEGTDLWQNRLILYLLVDGLLVGLGGGIAFMAKPTTALILAAISICWVAFHYQHARGMLFLGIASITACLVLFMHAILFKGGILSFYNELNAGLELGKILGGGHSLGRVFSQALGDIKQVPTRVFSLTKVGFLLSPFVLWLVRWNRVYDRQATASFILYSFLIVIPIVASYRLWENGQWSRMGMGFGGTALLLVLFFSALLTLLAQNKKGYIYGRITFTRLIGLCLFLFMLAVAYAFGSNSGLMRQMSGAYVFLAAGALYTAFWIDQCVERKLLSHLISVLIVVSVLVVMLKAFYHPYRLPEKISEQVVESSFLIGNGSLYVDKSTAGYISDLKRVALEAGWTIGTPLIDMTGASPGATVILGGRIMGKPWLAGGYKGSNEFVKTVLRLIPKSERRLSWILTAPKGKRKLKIEILSDIGLNFPMNYMIVGKVRTGYRKEIQLLWKPLGGTGKY